VINWFNKISNKPQHHFIIFDIVNFYPSITEELLDKAIVFASRYNNITTEDLNIIKQTKRSALIHDNSIFEKKGEDAKFDVTMGSYDGAEVCELVGAYIMSHLADKYGTNIGIYRDDGIAAFNKTPKQIENIKKDICKTFKDNKLKITINANQKVVNYLDITLNLNNGTIRPYNKPNNIPLYVNKNSSHPPSILKNIPKGINGRLTSIASDKKTFDTSTNIYQEALAKAGYAHKLEYKETEKNKAQKKNRQRQILWYNPPFSCNVSTNIGRKFLCIIEKSFPPNHKLNKIFNKNTIKISYCCTPNIKSIISSHNHSLLAKETQSNNQEPECNCRTKHNCPLNGKCLTRNIIYQATVTRVDNKHTETYVGITENNFKLRYANHTASFKDEKKRNDTELSKYIWSLREQNVKYEMKWKIEQKCASYTNTTKKCKLCTTEKYIILCENQKASLNKRSEIMATCRHRKKYLLAC